jgi:hypothetical protein
MATTPPPPRAARQQPIGETAHISQEVEVETDHGVDAAALEAEMAAALADLDKEDTPKLKTTFNIGPK